MNRLSRIFQPINKIPKDALLKNKQITSRSQKLMLDLGIIRPSSPGSFHLLPLGLRALEKLKFLIDNEMFRISGQKIMMPTLTQAVLWEKSGRLNDTSDLFKLHDRHENMYILSPTHEESITDMLASIGDLSYKHMPLRLYQITSKYRDEMKTRFGLLRGRQFVMKDLYTFDVDMEKARETYLEVSESYRNILHTLGIDFIEVHGATGTVGGVLSHEFHYMADVGEDKLFLCLNCNYKGNIEISGTESCPKCKSYNIHIQNGIEVGHTFLLGDKYSKPLNATFFNQDGKATCLKMGCYGLGVSRILAAALEVLSLEEELRWPMVLAPYKVVIIPPKDGSKEQSASHLDEDLYRSINTLQNYNNNVLIDDRKHLTIGKRYLEARRMGYPYIIVIAAKAMQNPPLYEINEVLTMKQFFLGKNELLQYLRNIQ